MKKIAIIDYKVGNLFSIQNAIRVAGGHSEIVSYPHELHSFDAAVFPGVGAFGEAIAKLKETSFDEATLAFIKTGKSLLGICLGLQLLLDESEEFGKHKGLGIIPGKVQKFPSTTSKGNTIIIPKVGWNSVKVTSQGQGNKITADLKNGSDFYFVHSFFANIVDKKHVLLETNYEEITYASGIAKDNVVAFQFHPERSGQSGIMLLNKWIKEN